jgi:DNA-binding transcriptional ArsR family regulator
MTIEAQARAARALADETRLRILLALIEREATVSELAAGLGVPQPRISTHLATLARAGLVHAERSGRRRYYAADAARVEPVLTGLQLAAGEAEPSAGAAREIAHDTPLRRARRCYDHLAGVAGVELLDELLARDWLATEPNGRGRPHYVLRPVGEAALAARGVDLAAARRARRLYAFGCPDWTERRPHLGGALGHEIAGALERAGVIERATARREVALRRPVADWLGAA